MHGYLRQETEYVVRYVSELGEKGYILWSNLRANNASRVIRDEVSYFRRLNQAFEWKVYDCDEPDSLKDLLAHEGLTPDDPEAVMVVQLDEQHPLLRDETDINVQEITDHKGIQDIVNLEEAIWNTSFASLGERLTRDKSRDPDFLYLYGVYEDNRLVSAAWMYVEPNSSFVSLWGGSTLPAFRKQGCYTELLNVRAKKAMKLNHPFLTVDASPMSRPILEKHGFTCIALAYGYQSPSFKES